MFVCVVNMCMSSFDWNFNVSRILNQIIHRKEQEKSKPVTPKKDRGFRLRYPAWPVWSAMNRFAVAVSFLGHTTALALGVASEKRLGDQTLEGRLAYVILGCFLRSEALCRERIAAFDNLFLRDKFGSVWSKSNSAWENVEHIRISLNNVAYSTRAGAWLIGNAVGICLDPMQYKPHIWFPV